MYGKIADAVSGMGSRWLFFGTLMGCMAVMVVGMTLFGIAAGFAVALVPLLLLLLLAILKDPFWGFLTLFFANYFIIVAFRYSYVTGLSVGIDVLILLTFVSLILHTAGKTGRVGRLRMNGLIAAAALWLLYCTLELLNPRSMVDAWLFSRGTTFYFLIMVLLTFLTFRTVRDIKIILYVLSVFTLVGALKGVMQQVVGFDAAERHFLNEIGASTHLLPSGIRYFSIFASAGIFGAVMGHAFVVYFIVAFYTKGWERIYFIFVAGIALYAMMISGTRGAMAIPAAGLLLFILLSKRIRIMLPALVLFAGAYFFFAETTIGQSNAYIRRMRTVLDPHEPSLMVRKENQRLLAEYLSDKPFGEGLGLSGVDARPLSQRFTTSVPTDSWYVKIWVETGIVGVCLHIAILAFIVIYGSYLLLFRIRDELLKGMLTALHCGVFGILVASYGNQVLGQFPVVLIVYMSMALVFMGPELDRRIDLQREERSDKRNRLTV